MNETRPLRSVSLGLRLPVILLALIAASPRVDVSSSAAEAPAPPPVSPVEASIASMKALAAQAPAAPAPSVSSAPPAGTAQPAVTTPATTLLAKGVPGLSPRVLRMALDSVACAKASGASGRDDLLTVIDYSLPSTQRRLWVLDLAKGEVLYNELVAHGRGSGDNYATRFSNRNDSHQTSLGLFLTTGTYQGGNGYSLRLQGLDEGINDRAEARHIVMHGAWYVSAEHARRQGRLGRSHGCPALSQEMAPRVIDTIKGGSFLFSYAGDESWLKTASSNLNRCGGGVPTAPITALAVSTAL